MPAAIGFLSLTDRERREERPDASQSDVNSGKSATFRRIDDGALSLSEAQELNTRPDHAVRARSRISHLTRDRQIDGGTGPKPHRNATVRVQSQHTALPQTEELYWIGVAEVDPHTERRDIRDRALPPQIRWLVFDMAAAHPTGRPAFCPSAILHVPASQRCGAAPIGKGHAPLQEMLTVGVGMGVEPVGSVGPQPSNNSSKARRPCQGARSPRGGRRLALDPSG